jgi:N-acetylglutamate synthase-like GNAT family acetyltransferase
MENIAVYVKSDMRNEDIDTALIQHTEIRAKANGAAHIFACNDFKRMDAYMLY